MVVSAEGWGVGAASGEGDISGIGGGGVST